MKQVQEAQKEQTNRQTENEKKRTKMINMILISKTFIPLDLQPLLSIGLGITMEQAKVDTQWIRRDLEKNLWIKAGPYSKFSVEDKFRIFTMTGIKTIPKTVNRDVMMAKLIDKLSMEDAPAKNANSDELRLTFASPDTAVFSNAVVKQVDVPTLAGMVGVLANHVPTIGVLKPGVVSVTTIEGAVQRFFVSSGTLSVNIDGSCHVIAEKVDDADEAVAGAELESAQRASGEESEVARAEAQKPEKTTEYLESFLGKELETIHTAMAQSVPPGDINTQPDDKITFNAPYDERKFCYLTLINSSAHQLAYALKTTDTKRLGVDPPCGVLDPKKAVLLAVSCDDLVHGQEETNNDHITVEWTNTPDGAAKQFDREWFQGDGMVRRKKLPIQYKNAEQGKSGKKSLEDDKTQSGRSGENSPELTLSSKLRKIEIRRKEEEEEQQQVYGFKIKQVPPPTSIRRYLFNLTTFVQACSPPEQANRLEQLIVEKGKKKLDAKISSDQMMEVMRGLCYSVKRTVCESYECYEAIQVPVSSLCNSFTDFIKQLGSENAVDEFEYFQKGSAEKANKTKKFSWERIGLAVEQSLLEF